MRPDPTILGFDTSAAHCAAALLCTNEIRAERHEELARGQAERLMPMLEEMLAECDLNWADLDAIAVGIGPGNFTGIRISVAAARGLGMALGIPVIGISNFEIMRGGDAGFRDASELVSVSAPRGQAYVQHMHFGKPAAGARLIDLSNPPAALKTAGDMIVTGYQANDLAQALGAKANPTELEAVGARMVRRAEWRLVHNQEKPDRPAPLYVRAPDAAPPRDAAPVILDA